jgi:pre-mRNA-processing factor 19
VVSLKSGHVFEKSLIEKHLQVTGTCPVTGEELHKEDLMDLKTNSSIQPRPPTATSIPGLIQLFQNEWDAIMLETHMLNKHLDSTRQELAHALYQHDAACRVIARLVKERDEAREMLANTQDNVAGALKKMQTSGPASHEDGKEPATGISDKAMKNMTNVAKTLSGNRKKLIKALSAEVARREKVKKYTVTTSVSLHSPSKGIDGILCLDLHPRQQELLMTGGLDTNAIIFNRQSGKILDTLKGHTKKITDVKFHPTEQVVFTTSADGSGIIWSQEPKSGKYTAQYTLKDHDGEVSGCTLHPSGQYLITASTDKSWCFYDVATGSMRQKVSDEKVTDGYTRVAFHPDGLILGAGTSDSIVRIFDVKAQKNVANFMGHTGKVTALSFSENGFFLASGDEKGVVKLWDLRKLQNFHTIPFKSADAIGSLEFDPSGSYLAVTGPDISIYTTKQWETVKTWNDHSKEVTALKFGNNADWFASTSKDRSLKIFTETD